MAIGRTKTNIRAQIDDQNVNLLQMVSDIADHYHKETIDFEDEVNRFAIDNSEGDNEIYIDLRDSYSNEIIKKYSLLVEARKILFCSIFSYCESMLYGIIEYYSIPINNINKIGQLIDKIFEEYDKRFSEKLTVPDDIVNTIRNYYRPLRNHFNHYKISLENDKNNLRLFAEKENRLIVYDGMKYEIIDNSFLRDALNTVNSFLVEIEESYDIKTRTLMK